MPPAWKQWLLMVLVFFFCYKCFIHPLVVGKGPFTSFMLWQAHQNLLGQLPSMVELSTFLNFSCLYKVKYYFHLFICFMQVSEKAKRKIAYAIEFYFFVVQKKFLYNKELLLLHCWVSLFCSQCMGPEWL